MISPAQDLHTTYDAPPTRANGRGFTGSSKLAVATNNPAPCRPSPRALDPIHPHPHAHRRPCCREIPTAAACGPTSTAMAKSTR